MTALLVIERLPLDQIVTITQAELDEVPYGMSIAYLRAGDQLSVLHLLYGLLLPSGSDAAVMNRRAAQIGLRATHYTTPYGALDQ